MNFTSELLRIQHELRISQKKLAILIGIRSTELNKYIKGQSAPGFAKAISIMNALDKQGLVMRLNDSVTSKDMVNLDAGSIPTMLRQIRLQADISRAELANRLGISDSAYSNFKLGKSVPTLETIVKILAEYKKYFKTNEKPMTTNNDTNTETTDENTKLHLLKKGFNHHMAKRVGPMAKILDAEEKAISGKELLKSEENTIRLWKISQDMFAAQKVKNGTEKNTD